MKKFLTTTILFFLLFANAAFAQSEVIEDISFAFKNADQRMLARHFNSKVEITLLDQSNVFSKSQAEMVMKDFFERYVPTDFNMMYNTSSGAEGTRFAIGQLDTQNGRFRIYFILKANAGVYILQEMRFEQERPR